MPAPLSVAMHPKSFDLTDGFALATPVWQDHYLPLPVGHTGIITVLNAFPSTELQCAWDRGKPAHEKIAPGAEK